MRRCRRLRDVGRRQRRCSSARAQAGYALRTIDARRRAPARRRRSRPAGLMVDRVPAEEWKQIFDECWRRYATSSTSTNMHGVDWAALRKQYEPLVAHVAHRADLTYVIGEMIARAERPATPTSAAATSAMPPRPRVGLPGARFELDKAGGPLPASPASSPARTRRTSYRSPLTELGVDVQGGRLHARDRRRGAEATDNPVPPAAEQGRRPVDADGQREARRRRARAR